MTILAIDNGATGSLALVRAKGGQATLLLALPTPSRREQNYTKAVSHIRRICWRELANIISEIDDDTKIVLERPMVNPMRFAQSIVAARAFEATIIAIEDNNRSYTVVDSKEWQKGLFGPDIKGRDLLKLKAKEMSRKLFPDAELAPLMDGDAVCMAYYYAMKSK